MDKVRKDVLINIAELCTQLAEDARRHDFEVISALLQTVVARANSLVTPDDSVPPLH